jgi:hypothetical protein
VAGGLLGFPLQSNKPSNRSPDFRRDTPRIAAAAQSLFTQTLSLSEPIPSSARTQRQISADSRFITPQYLGDLGSVMSVFHQCMDLVLFCPAEVWISHLASSIGSSKRFDANLTELPDPLVNVLL